MARKPKKEQEQSSDLVCPNCSGTEFIPVLDADNKAIAGQTKCVNCSYVITEETL